MGKICFWVVEGAIWVVGFGLLGDEVAAYFGWSLVIGLLRLAHGSWLQATSDWRLA
jgi:hypothetical protein